MMYDDVLAQLTKKNCKLTPQRREIVKILIRAKTHLSARQIFDRLRKIQPGVSFDTVYRTIATLKELGIVNQLDFQDGRGRYELNREQGHHHHIVCIRCGEAWKIMGCPLEVMNIQNRPSNFKVINHRFEIFGYCEQCQK